MAENRTEAIKKLKKLIEGIDFCMLTTIDGDKLRSRPMSTQLFELDGDLWFFTSDNTHKVAEVSQDNRVNIAYSEPGSDRYVSVSGRAEIVKDRAKIEELWSPVLKAWFPEGLDDPSLSLLKVTVDEAEYWDTPSGAIVQLVGFVKAIATGKEMAVGEHQKISF